MKQPSGCRPGRFFFCVLHVVRAKRQPRPVTVWLRKHTPTDRAISRLPVLTAWPRMPECRPFSESPLLRLMTARRIGARLRARIEGHGDSCRMHGERPDPTQRSGAIRFRSPQSGVRAADISF